MLALFSKQGKVSAFGCCLQEAMRTLSLIQHSYYYISEPVDLSDSKSSYPGL